MNEKLFGIAFKHGGMDKFSDALIADFYKIGCVDTKLNYLAYALSRMAEHDLDANVLIFGFARIGKSTLLLQFIRKIYSFRLGYMAYYPNKNNHFKGKIDQWLIDQEFVHNHLVYDSKQSLKDIFKKYQKEVIGSDEGYLTADRRESMGGQSIKLTQVVNAYAYCRNINFTLIQNLSDIDKRYVEKSNVAVMITERSGALVFAKNQNFPIIKSYYGFERFIDDPDLIANYDTGKHNFKRLKSFISTLSWRKLAKLDANGDIDMATANPFYKTYIKEKKLWTGNITEQSEEIAPVIDTKKPNSATCLRCGYMWTLKRAGTPAYCPKCNRHDWDNKETPHIEDTQQAHNKELSDIISKVQQ